MGHHPHPCTLALVEYLRIIALSITSWFYCIKLDILARYPWGQEAFEKARSEDKPIFLSVGYSTCHWCHVMERESFESEEIEDILRENFVSIKVDREERPDVDKVYTTFIQVRGNPKI